MRRMINRFLDLVDDRERRLIHTTIAEARWRRERLAAAAPDARTGPLADLADLHYAAAGRSPTARTAQVLARLGAGYQLLHHIERSATTRQPLPPLDPSVPSAAASVAYRMASMTNPAARFQTLPELQAAFGGDDAAAAVAAVHRAGLRPVSAGAGPRSGGVSRGPALAFGPLTVRVPATPAAPARPHPSRPVPRPYGPGR